MKNKKIFFIGMPRSGTTLIFDSFVSNQDVGWISQYLNKFPRLTLLSVFNRFVANKNIGTRNTIFSKYRTTLRLVPSEAYKFWNTYTKLDFSNSYLFNERAELDVIEKINQKIIQLLDFQNKSVFAQKFTGPGRITYLHSLFPDAYFINIIRDGRAVVNSLMNVNFWKERGGYEKPWWNEGLKEDDIDLWKNSDYNPYVLAAVQWAKVVTSTREEAKILPKNQYLEVKYEDFIKQPNIVFNQISALSGLPQINKGYDLFPQKNIINQNKKFRDQLQTKDLQLIEEVINPLLQSLNY